MEEKHVVCNGDVTYETLKKGQRVGELGEIWAPFGRYSGCCVDATNAPPLPPHCGAVYLYPLNQDPAPLAIHMNTGIPYNTHYRVGCLSLRAQIWAPLSCLKMRFTHRTAFAVSPTNLIAGRSTWEGEGHKTNTHAYDTRAWCVGHIRKNTVTRKIVQLG